MASTTKYPGAMKNENKTTTREGMRFWREWRGWTMAELGRRLGISRQYVKQLEDGARPVNTAMEERLAKELDIPRGDLTRVPK